MWHRVWIRDRKLATRTSYYVCWYDRSGKQRSKLVGTDKRLAKDLCRKKEMQLNSGIRDEPQPISYDSFVEDHLAIIDGQVAPKTKASQSQALDRLKELIGPKRLDDITHREAELFVAARSKQVKPATVNKEIRTLSAIFTKAVKRGFLMHNPFADIQKPREPERAIRVLTLDEIHMLLEAALTTRWKALIYLALTTGMRLGEMCHLEWDDVDLDSMVVTIQNKEAWNTKSKKVRRLALMGDAGCLLKTLQSTARSNWVFETRDGNPMRNNTQRRFQEIVKKAGIKHCTIHDLRRTFASHLAMAGVNEAVVQKLAGHASMSTTLKHYTHIVPDSLRRAQSSLPYASPGQPMLTLYGQAQDPAEKAKTA